VARHFQFYELVFSRFGASLARMPTKGIDSRFKLMAIHGTTLPTTCFIVGIATLDYERQSCNPGVTVRLSVFTFEMKD
jgi:hypothetical protein